MREQVKRAKIVALALLGIEIMILLTCWFGYLQSYIEFNSESDTSDTVISSDSITLSKED